MRIRIGLFAMAVVLLTSCQNDPVHDAIAAQLRQYPESRVQDIYKNFCQDNLGPGHSRASSMASGAQGLLKCSRPCALWPDVSVLLLSADGTIAFEAADVEAFAGHLHGVEH